MQPEVLKTLESDRGYSRAMGLELLRTEADLVELQWTVDIRHLNPFGIVHGGVFSGVVETVCSVGAYVGLPPGKAVVGMENQTSFLRPVTAGTRLLAQGRPVHRGRTTQLWEAVITDTEGRIVSTGRLRLMVIDVPSTSSNAKV